MKHLNFHIFSLLLLSTLSGCVINDDDNDKKKRPFVPTEKTAIINTVASDWSDSDIELVSFKNDISDENLVASAQEYATGLSDYSIAAYGEHYYRIGRYGIDTITKYSVNNPDTAIYSYSTLDDASSPTSNPYQLVFASEHKAYLIRYNSNKVWVINPSASSEAEFKIDEIDLEHYADADGNAEISDGVIVGGKLYITLQRLENWVPIEGNSYVVVIDTSTETEIDTNENDSPAELFGVPLKTTNPLSISYHNDAGLLVQSVGSYGSYPAYTPEYIGGVEKISTGDYSTTVILDDGDSSSHPYGLISNMAIISNTVGYIVGYTSWGNSSVYRFNPATGIVDNDAVADLSAMDIRSISASPGNSLWVSIGDNANPRVLVINTVSHETAQTITTIYNPGSVVFIEKQ